MNLKKLKLLYKALFKYNHFYVVNVTDSEFANLSKNKKIGIVEIDSFGLDVANVGKGNFEFNLPHHNQIQKYHQWLLKSCFIETKQWDLQTGHTVKEAFISGGEQYYELHDPFDMFVERGLEAYQIYEEILMRVDVESLDKFIDKFETDLNQNPIKIIDCTATLSFLKERRKFVIPPQELIWKMAAVRYFGENESPYKFDATLARKKIEKWKANGDIEDFFLYERLLTAIPLPKLSKEIYHLLQETIQKIQEKQSDLMNTSGSLSEV